MDEPTVVARVHRFLTNEGLLGQPVRSVYTDAHATLLPLKQLAPFQRFTFDTGVQRVHPDLFGQVNEEEGLYAIEAKGSQQVLAGLQQAREYRSGVQRSLLAVPAEVVTPEVEARARQDGVGLLAVHEAVEVKYLPEPHMPRWRLHRDLLEDLRAVDHVSTGGTFLYNLPTHYLAWCVALDRHGAIGWSDVAQRFHGYPLPQDLKATWRGARKLGLVVPQGDVVALTDAGVAIKDLIGGDMKRWAEVHRRAAARGGKGGKLWQIHPHAAAGLRLLLLQDPVVRLLLDGLKGAEGAAISFPELAERCARLDRRRAEIFFLTPGHLAQVDVKQGVRWDQMPGDAYRSTSYFQFKSMLVHAGVLDDHGLGSASSRHYQPADDLWQQRWVST